MGTTKDIVFQNLQLEFWDYNLKVGISMLNNTKTSLFYASKGLGWAINRTHVDFPKSKGRSK